MVRALTATFAASALVCQAASTIPSGGAFVAGSGSIAASGNSLTISQSSLRGIIDWPAFSIGHGGFVTFNNGSGATLNRVTGSQISSILGSLLATGSVYLLNPQGVLIGPGAHVNTGGDFVGSTLGISNDAFLKGGSLLFTGSGGTSTVVNLGSLHSDRGSIFLIGNSVTNGGSLQAAKGTAALGAGSQILLKDSTSDQRVFVGAGSGDVTNTGTIAAAKAELKANGGNIYALAGNSSKIAATGTANINGQAWLISNAGTTTVTGSVSASNANGKGGNIETSGEHLAIGGAHVTTGRGGNWLLDPVDLLIDISAASTFKPAWPAPM